ncbi:MAG: hypothetical protein ACREHF_13870 [Rhizomicrobium sp.]
MRDTADLRAVANAAVRSLLVGELGKRIQIPETMNQIMHRSPDALDSVIAIFAAVAAKSDSLAVASAGGEEGWIAVHE